MNSAPPPSIIKSRMPRSLATMFTRSSCPSGAWKSYRPDSKHNTVGISRFPMVATAFRKASEASSPESGNAPKSRIRSVSPNGRDETLPIHAVARIGRMYRLIFIEVRLGFSTIRGISSPSKQCSEQSTRLIVEFSFHPEKSLFRTVTLRQCWASMTERPANRGSNPAGIDEPVPADDERIDRESINQLVVERLHEVSFETDTSVIRSPPAPGIMRNNGVDLQNGLGRPAAGSHRANRLLRITTLRVRPDSNQ